MYRITFLLFLFLFFFVSTRRFSCTCITVQKISTLRTRMCTFCTIEPAEAPPHEPPANPCVPSPCGPNAVCRAVGNTPACSCHANYIGRPPNCRPECMINAECAGNLACQNERCRDPCPGSCGLHAVCAVTNHVPRCTCEDGYTGDPFVSCSIVQSEKKICKKINRPILARSL